MADFNLDADEYLSETFAGLDRARSEIDGVLFEGCRFESCDFSGTDFTHSQFGQTNLGRANFCDATGYRIDINSNFIGKARFSRLEALSLLDSLDIELLD
jgi:uncharacterized protein YjbI with pentapeptide repeats